MKKKALFGLIILLIAVCVTIFFVIRTDSGLPRHSSLDDITFEENVVNVYYFWGNGCPHCARQFEFLNEINVEIGEKFNLYAFEVWHNEDNAELVHEIAEMMDTTFRGVPFTVIGDQVITGFRPDEILAAIDSAYDAEFDVMRIFKGE